LVEDENREDSSNDEGDLHEESNVIFKISQEGSVESENEENDEVNADRAVDGDTSRIQSGNSDNEDSSEDDEQLLHQDEETSVAHILLEGLVQEASDVVRHQDRFFPVANVEGAIIVHCVGKFLFKNLCRSEDHLVKEIRDTKHEEEHDDECCRPEKGLDIGTLDGKISFKTRLSGTEADGRSDVAGTDSLEYVLSQVTQMSCEVVRLKGAREPSS
jgi:hypothetical protein